MKPMELQYMFLDCLFQLADAVGFSFTVERKYVSGKVTPPADRLEAIVKDLGGQRTYLYLQKI